jgi:hypothetical protein
MNVSGEVSRGISGRGKEKRVKRMEVCHIYIKTA